MKTRMLVERPSGGMVTLLQTKERGHERDLIVVDARTRDGRGFSRARGRTMERELDKDDGMPLSVIGR